MTRGQLANQNSLAMPTSTPSLALEEVSLPDRPFTPLGIASGKGNRLQLEVVYSKHGSVPAPTRLRAAQQRMYARSSSRRALT
jgi:hypothetical protein